MPPRQPKPSPRALSLLGAHVSTSGGVSSAIPRAKAIGATAMQIFTKQASQWKEPAIADEERAAYHIALVEAAIAVTNAHDSYLINLASPDPVLWTRSLISFMCELRRCEHRSKASLAERGHDLPRNHLLVVAWHRPQDLV